MKTIKFLIAISIMLTFVSSSFGVVEHDTIYVTQTGNFIKIDWQTSSELNNDYFTVERSIDSINYSAMKVIIGAGNSSSINNYSYTDSSIVIGQTYFYRVKDTEFNGAFSFSDTVQIQTTSSTGIQPLPTISFQLFPNPITEYATLNFSKSKNTKYNLKIFDINGKIVRSIENILSTQIIIPRDNLKSGLYILKVYSEEAIIISEKLIFE